LPGRNLAPLLGLVVFIGKAPLGGGHDLKRVGLGAMCGGDQCIVSAQRCTLQILDPGFSTGYRLRILVAKWEFEK
jgi:hypothetical protein